MTAAPTDDRLFRAVFEGTLDALLLADDDGTYLDANEAACELFGCSREELVGRSIGGFLPPETAFDPLWEEFLEEGTARGQLELHRPDGEVRTVEFAATAEIRPGVHLSAIRDISQREADRFELRRQTDLLSSVFQTAPIGIVVIDADGNIVDANERAQATLGLPYEELTASSYDDERWRPVDEDGTLLSSEELPVSRVLDTGEAVFDFEHGIERNGELVWLSVNAEPLYDDGSIDRVVATISDITDRREYRRMLEAQNERLEEYSATVSHDLRGPLSIASGWLDVAIEEETTEPLEKVESALDRMGDLIADLRQLGRYGQTVDEMEELELRDLAESAWSNVQTGDATLELDERIGTVRGEESRLLQLFENLFRNSVEHGVGDAQSPGEDAEATPVRVRVGSLDDGFYVEDDGPGIPADERDDVFEFGYSTTEDGTGIGLAIVEAVADSHGWEHSLVDADPHGARFEFRRRWHPEQER